MTENSTVVRPPSRAMRAAAHAVIRPRPRAGVAAGIGLSVMFALIATGLALGDRLLGAEIEAGEPAPITVRVPTFGGFQGGVELSGGAIVVSRGQVVDAERAALANQVLASTGQDETTAIVLLAGFLIVGLLYTSNLRRSHRGKLVRTQAVTLVMLLCVAAAVKVALLLTPVSLLIVPLAGIALLATIVVDLSTGLTTGVVAAGLFGALVPFDLGVISVLGVQAIATVLVLGERRGRLDIVVAGAFGGLAAAVAYVTVFYLSSGVLPTEELESPLRSAWVAALASGPISAVAAIVAQPVYQYLLGDITRNTLVDLEDLSNPLLEQIAENAPGTWQHSLAMANMAEIAANAIGANGRLVRTGAYYHDLGKSVQPKYFIENLNRGEPSPHDSLVPAVSCDAIFAHVTEGVRLARKHGLPERIIDFMHMHHGDGLLEYFWAKCQEQGNPDNLTESDFRYPGVKPQSKETAILAICDAVEAASRTLKRPDEKSIRNLVQRIVYGKLHLGQLDESDLSMSDLRKISESLIGTVKHASHDRIEYPWQREQREASDGATDAPPPRREEPVSATQRIIGEPRLDSLDAPRPYWRGETAPVAAIPLGAPSDPADSLPEIEISGGESEPDDNTPTSERAAQRPVEAPSAAQPAPEAPIQLDIDDGIDEISTPRRSNASASNGRKPPALVIDDDDQEDDDFSDFDDDFADPDSDQSSDPGNAEDELEQRITNPVPIPPNDAVPESAEDEGSQAVFTSAPDPRQDLFATPPREPKNTGLADWETALSTVGSEPGDGARDGERKKPTTIELMKRKDRNGSPLDHGDDVPARATTEDPDSLAPGMLVLGPPPATHPDRSFHHDEPTVERAIIPSKDAIRPSRVITEEHEIEVPPEAFPGDDTEPLADPPVDGSEDRAVETLPLEAKRRKPPPPPRGKD